MNPADFIYKQILDGAIKQKAKPSIARSCAQEGLDKFKKGMLGGKKASHLIEGQIKKAIKESKR